MELATIIRHGIEEMYVDDKDVGITSPSTTKITPMPPKPKGVDDGIIKGMYLLRGPPKGDVSWSVSSVPGPIMVQVLDAVEKLET